MFSAVFGSKAKLISGENLIISEVAGHLHMNRFYKNFRYAGKKADWFYDM